MNEKTIRKMNNFINSTIESMNHTLEFAKDTGKDPAWVVWSLHKAYDEAFGALVFMNCYMGMSDEIYDELRHRAQNELFKLSDEAYKSLA